MTSWFALRVAFRHLDTTRQSQKERMKKARTQRPGACARLHAPPPSLTCCVATFRRTGIWIKVLGTGQPNRSPHGWYTEIRCAVAQVSLTSAFPSGSDDAHVGERRSGPPIGRVNEDICDTVFPAGNLAQLNGRSARPFGHAHVMIPRRFF